jgi:hypothetical protein
VGPGRLPERVHVGGPRWWAKADAAEIFGEDFKNATGTLGMISRVGRLAGAPIAIAGDVSTLFTPAQSGAAGMADRVMAGTNGVLVAGTRRSRVIIAVASGEPFCEDHCRRTS